MASESTARPKDLEGLERKTSGTRPRAPQPEPRLVAHEIPPPPPSSPEATKVKDAPIDFEAHDTIPAPPWLGDES